tara:strand:- start:4151 stop:4420 length:270 start_codon:yes stop_codon:yes gene_type:complete
MGKCGICEINDIEFFFGSWCKDCRRLKHIINLFSLEKIMSVLDSVLIVDESTQKNKINEELKNQLIKKEYRLRTLKLKTIEEENQLEID